MKHSDSITIFQLTLMVTTFCGIKNHVLLIPPLLQTAGRDGWMSCIVALLFILVWGFLLIFIHRGTQQQHLTLWFKNTVGTPGAFVFMLLICFVLFTIAVADLRETVSWTKNIYMPNTPSWVLALSLSLLCFLTAASNLRTISIINFSMIFFLVSVGTFVAIINIPLKNYQLLLPFYENGPIPILKASIYPASGLVELMMMLFLQHKIEGPIRYRHILINAFILVILIIGPLIGSITEFGPSLAAKQRYPAYEQLGLARLGSFVEHMDYLSIFLWLSGVYIRISTVLFILIDFTGIQTERTRRWVFVFLFLFVNGLVLIPLTDMQFFSFMTYILIPVNLFILLGLSFIWGLILILQRGKETRKSL
jgi:spore germination protein (amino acid permease)